MNKLFEDKMKTTHSSDMFPHDVSVCVCFMYNTWKDQLKISASFVMFREHFTIEYSF